MRSPSEIQDGTTPTNIENVPVPGAPGRFKKRLKLIGIVCLVLLCLYFLKRCVGSSNDKVGNMFEGTTPIKVDTPRSRGSNYELLYKTDTHFGIRSTAQNQTYHLTFSDGFDGYRVRLQKQDWVEIGRGEGPPIRLYCTKPNNTQLVWERTLSSTRKEPGRSRSGRSVGSRSNVPGNTMGTGQPPSPPLTITP